MHECSNLIQLARGRSTRAKPEGCMPLPHKGIIHVYSTGWGALTGLYPTVVTSIQV